MIVFIILIQYRNKKDNSLKIYRQLGRRLQEINDGIKQLLSLLSFETHYSMRNYFLKLSKIQNIELLLSIELFINVFKINVFFLHLIISLVRA